jgi:putative spermidine/putrescine transport system permease protein
MTNPRTRATPLAWLIYGIGVAYFLIPLLATLEFSLKAKKGAYTLTAYRNVLSTPAFYESFGFSLQMAVLTIIVGVLLVLPTVYWVQLKLPRLRPLLEFIALVPFVVPAVVLVYGLIKIYSKQPLLLTPSPALLVAGYVVLALPYLFRSIDNGLRTIDIRTLTEAAQSLGASWATIIFRVIAPNVRVALLSGAFLTFATVMGEFTLASLLVWPAFAPYMNLTSSSKVYEPSALAVLSFVLTWAAIGLIQVLSGRRSDASNLGGAK